MTSAERLATVAFLGLRDLIRSKETERESDWQDVALLEEIADLRAIAAARSPADRSAALASLRSRRGFEEVARRHWLREPGVVAEAATSTRHPLPLAYLAPAGGSLPPEAKGASAAVREVLDGPLRTVSVGSARHLALVEAVRRLYKREAMEADRADKEAASRPT